MNYVCKCGFQLIAVTIKCDWQWQFVTDVNVMWCDCQFFTYYEFISNVIKLLITIHDLVINIKETYVKEYLRRWLIK